MNLPRVSAFNVRLPSLRVRLDVQTVRDWLSEHPYWAIGGSVYIVVFLATAVFLLVSGQGEATAQDEFRARIGRLSGISAGAATRAGEIEREFQEIQESFPPPDLRETDVFKAMRQLVIDTGLDVNTSTIELKSDVPRQAVGSTEYRVMTFSMSVLGEFDEVWAFIQKLDQGQGPFATLVLGEVSFSLADSSAADMAFQLYTLPTGEG